MKSKILTYGAVTMKYFISLMIIIPVLFANNLYSQSSLKPESIPETIDTASTIDIGTFTNESSDFVSFSIPIEVDERCTDFFNTIMIGEVGKSYEALLKGSPLSRNEEKIRNQVIKTLEANELYGKMTGFEKAGADYVSESYLKVRYLSLHPFNPLLWTFTFYNSPTIGWIVLNLKLTDTF